LALRRGARDGVRLQTERVVRRRLDDRIRRHHLPSLQRLEAKLLLSLPAHSGWTALLGGACSKQAVQATRLRVRH
jgi:hypothetical protein